MEHFFRLFEQITYTRSTNTTNISTKSEPEIVKKGTSASPATALANKVLPVPEGPTITKSPFGIFTTKGFWNFSVHARNPATPPTSSFCFIATCNIRKVPHFDLILVQHFSAAFTKTHGLTAATLHLTHEEKSIPLQGITLGTTKLKFVIINCVFQKAYLRF